ncbi:hypothetical protein JCM3765_002603 [Sporobolomyces pararoseus]
MFHRNYPTSYDFDSYSRPSPSPFSPLLATPSSLSPLYTTHDSFLPPSYDAYDSHRSQLERQLLARKQQERREAEAAAYLARQRQFERQAAIEQAIKEEQQRRELEEALRYREEMVRRAREEELKRDYVEALRARELEARRRRQIQEQEEQQRRKFIEETKKRQSTTPQARAQLPRSSKQLDMNDLFKLLLGSSQAEKQEEEQEEQPRKKVESAQPSSSPRQVETPDLLRLLFGVPTTSSAPSQSPSPSPSPVSQQPSTQTPESAPSIQVTAPSPSPATPAPTPVNKDEAHSSDDEAATTVQRQFRRHLARRNALSKISALASDFADRQRSFEKPTTFVFRSAPSSDSSAPALAFGSANSNFLSYEDFLVNLLSKIDAVESGGDRQVKKERKALVRKVDRELARLDSMRQRAWEEQQSKEAQTQAQAVETEKEDEVMMEAETAEVTAQADPDTTSSSSPDNVAITSPISAGPEPALTVESSSLETSSIDPSKKSSPDSEVDNLEPLLPEPLESDNEKTPPPPQLTKEALSSLAPPAPRESDETTSSSPSPNPPASESGSSTTSSTLTISTEDSPMSDLIEEVLKRAEKLGAEVEKLEAAELKNDKLEESEQKQEEGFVVV